MAGWPMVVAALCAVSCGGGEDCCTMKHDASVDSPADSTADAPVDAKPDAPPDGPTVSGACNLLTQSCGVGEKCTWMIDAVTPQYVGHIACAPDGTANQGESCMYGAPGASGFDNCRAGLVCGNYRGGAGTCKPICDLQGGAPACDGQHACVSYSGLFTTGPYTTAAGVCDLACDPLGDNDFDGSGALTRGSGCGSNPNVGCYGYPSYGTPPATGWTCTGDIHASESQPLGLRHRVACTDTNGCADPGPAIYVNSCNQGYLPLLYESSGSTTIICVAMCKPLNCYAGNCGTNDVNRFGAAPHACNNTDAVGSFNQAANGEHCQFLWWREVDDAGNFLPSPTSDTVGFCFDMSKYKYDSNGDNIINGSDLTLPACAQLQDGVGSGSNKADPLTYFGAVDLGCVDSTHRPLAFSGKPRPSRGMDALGVRALYHRTMGSR